jgi:MoaA/NifB/PqqE/SkfB family radical SAM enzyme
MLTTLSSKRLANRELSLEEYRSGETILASRPRYVLVELTRGCNLTCPMCRKQRVPFADTTMSGDLFRQLVGLFDTAEMVDLRGWGESLLLPEFVDCLSAVTSSGAAVRVVTNLSFRRPEALRALCEAPHSNIVASLDSADPEVLAQLRPGANLTLITENLRYLSRFIGKGIDTLAIQCTVQRPAIGGLTSLIELAADCGVPEIHLAPVSVGDRSPLSLLRIDTGVSTAMRNVALEAKRLGVRLVATSRLGDLPDNPGGIPACIRPWMFASVSFAGDIGFCDHLIGPLGDQFAVGRLQDQPFDDIWNGPRWEALRREHVGRRDMRARHFGKCAGCYRERYIDFDDMFVPETTERKVYLA